MLSYILKRVLIMVPTLFAIVFVVFILVNIAPGTPGQAQNVSGTQSADDSANARESYRLFKLQYNLDKPIVLNFRFLIGEERVAAELERVAGSLPAQLPGEMAAHHVGRNAAQTLERIVNAPLRVIDEQLEEDGLSEQARERLVRQRQELARAQVPAIRPRGASQAALFRAQERLENWGREIAPELLNVAEHYVSLQSERGERRSTVSPDTFEPAQRAALWRGESVEFEGARYRLDRVMTEKLRALAVQRLTVNAREPLLRERAYNRDEVRQRNREIVASNRSLESWSWNAGASVEEQEAVLEAWRAWLQEHRSELEPGLGGRIAGVFTETRFARYVANLLPFDVSPGFHFRAPDLGTSMRFRRPVLEVIGEHWRYSVLLSVLSLLLSYIISVPIGVFAAVRQGSAIADRGVGLVLFVLYSLPVFFAATVVQTYLTAAKGIPLFPVSGFDSGRQLEMTYGQYLWDVTRHLVLPVACLTYASLAALSRYARSGLLEVIRSDYIRTARAKGLPEWIVVTKHAVRNGMIPIITLLGSTLPVLIGGSIIVEFIFNIEGMGALMLLSIGQRDYNVIMGILLISSVLTLIGILLSDIAYALVDPRISFD